MPIYEYTCQSCQHHFEEIQKISDPVVMPCPKCGKNSKRQISQTSFALKGEGWYKDGYAKPTKKEAAAAPAANTTPASNVTSSSTPSTPTPAVPPSPNKGGSRG